MKGTDELTYDKADETKKGLETFAIAFLGAIFARKKKHFQKEKEKEEYLAYLEYEKSKLQNEPLGKIINHNRIQEFDDEIYNTKTAGYKKEKNLKSL